MKEVIWNVGKPNPKQEEFFKSRTLYTAYGGAKGGGKTWAVRVKAVGGALMNPGIRILIMRRTYPELEENHIRPILRLAPKEVSSYNGSSRVMTFKNGSTIKFGHWAGEMSEQEYQGLEFDWIFIDEATQFTERAFNFLGGCLRGVNAFPKRMYLTCNPGGVGHSWVKRLFIDRDFRTDSADPEERENPEDYSFIPATVEDNEALMRSSPGYLRMLANMPESLRAAYRYGDWDSIGGNYFPEFRLGAHTCEPFRIPEHWRRYRSIDYGLDALACLWWAVDEDGRSWCYREWKKKGLIVRDAAAGIIERTLPGERIEATFAPPDLWARQKDTGRTMAELFAQGGVPLIKADNNRVQGHMIMKDMMTAMPLNDPYVKSLFPEGKCPEAMPAFMLFDDLEKVIEDIESIQADEKNPNDCAKDPHDVTHTVDACRYFLINRSRRAEKKKKRRRIPPLEFLDSDDTSGEDYEAYMCGGEINADYLG
ncbi:MAG: phage terminase large subunit [Oscillospiraceae bacterium]|nr:phage terminase large subunit [Oscillospiraceae bacterium]